MYSNNLRVYNTQNTDTTGSHRNRSSYTDSSCVCTALVASSACACVRWRYSAVVAVCTCSVVSLCMGEMEGSGRGPTGESDAASSACACVRWICGVVSASPACVCTRRRPLRCHLPVHMCDGRLVGIARGLGLACLCVHAWHCLLVCDEALGTGVQTLSVTQQTEL
jgi:hypothetical protein